MRPTVGLSIHDDRVDAVLEVNGRVEWRCTQPRHPDQSLRDVVRTVLLEFLPRRRLRPRVVASLAGSMSALRRIHGLPAGLTSESATQIVRGQPERFFCIEPGTVEVTPTVLLGGHWWGGHVDRTSLEHVVGGCSDLGASLGPVIPSAALRARPGDHSMPGETDEDASDLTLEPSVREEDSGELYADALGVSRLAAPSPFSVYPTRDADTLARRRILRRILVGTAVSCLLLSLSIPGIWATRDITRYRRATMALGLDTLRLESASHGATLAVDLWRQLDHQFASAPLAISVLGMLAEALPDSSALLSFRFERDWSSIVVLSADAASVIQLLESAPGIESVEVDGAISSEGDGETARERFALRIRTSPIAGDPR